MTKLFNALEKIEPFYEWTEKVLMFICKLLLIADICITTYSVCGRLLHEYIPFLKDPSWTEEMVLTLMSYMAVLSAALAIRHKAHIRMDVFDPMLPKKVLQVSNVICDIGVLVLGVVMLVVGWQYASTLGSRGFYVSMTWLSRFWMYFPIPLAGFFMIIFEIEAILTDLKEMFEKEAV